MTDVPAEVALKAVKADEISFINNLDHGQTIALSFKYTHNLRYTGPGIAQAELTVVGEDAANPGRFSLKIVETGVFFCPPSLARDEVHVQTFRLLFTFVRALAATVTAAAGVPPITVPPIEIDKDNIYHIEFKPPKP